MMHSKADFGRWSLPGIVSILLSCIHASFASTEQLSSIFEACCSKPDACQEWRPVFSSKNATIQAICSLATITCDSQQNIIGLNASGMGLTCNLPDAPIQEMQKLHSLDLSNNSISGPIPEFLPESLVEIRLNNNNLIGAIPHSLATHPNLEILDVDHNDIESLPIEWTSMVYDADNSPFPLQSLHLAFNSIQGPFPQGLAYFPFLNVLQLQNNALSGPIEPHDSPNAFLQLNMLDVSENKLSGSLPSWTDSVNTVITGAGNSFTSPTSPSSSSGLSGGAIAGIVIGVLVGVACVIAGTLVYMKRRHPAPETKSTNGLSSNTYERYI